MSLLSVLGLASDQLPTRHADRRAHLEKRRKRILSDRVQAEERARAKIVEAVAVHDKVAADLEEQAREIELRLGNELASSLYGEQAALRVALKAWLHDSSRLNARAVMAAIRAADALARETLGSGLRLLTLAIAHAVLLVDERPELVSHFGTRDAWSHMNGRSPASSSSRAIKAALNGSGNVAEVARALEELERGMGGIAARSYEAPGEQALRGWRAAITSGTDAHFAARIEPAPHKPAGTTATPVIDVPSNHSHELTLRPMDRWEAPR